MVDYLEDIFVNGVYYDSKIKLFIGAPSKQKHIAILEKYYSKFRGNPNLPWSTVRRLVRNMFSQDYGGVNGVKLHFYSITVLFLDLLCFIIIVVSYALIYSVSLSSTRQLKGKRNGVTNLSMQRKLTMIIVTDFFCWVPFITMSALHYLGTVDASPWYATFSIVILPINSVINPLLYCSDLTILIRKVWTSSMRMLGFETSTVITGSGVDTITRASTTGIVTLRANLGSTRLESCTEDAIEPANKVRRSATCTLQPTKERHKTRMERRQRRRERERASQFKLSCQLLNNSMQVAGCRL